MDYSENILIETDWIVAEDAAPYGNENFPMKEDTYKLIGICMEVHRILGHGFLEIVYKDAIEKELQWKHVQYEREKKYVINYKEIILPHSFHADFVVNQNIILEVKAQQGLPESFYAQVINYLAASKAPVGLLINFGEPSLKYKRFVFTPKKSVQSE
ncbi:MAG: GxxExxY protein [Bacteroidia bacterium]